MKNQQPIIDAKFESSLQSFLAHDLIDFVRRKRAAGILYKTEVHSLRKFDSFVFDNSDKYHAVDRALGEGWVLHLKDTGKHVNSLIKICTPVCSFFRYMFEIGKGSYIFEPNPLGKPIRYTPHKITDEELVAFFKAADNVRFYTSTPLRHLTAPAAFRLLYSSGLRVSEIRNLRCNDVDLNSGILMVRESKARGLRIVALHPDMITVLKHYDAQINELVPDRVWFFTDELKADRQMPDDKLGIWFNQIWKTTEASQKSKPPKMTARDFRHRHATDVTAMWQREGKEIHALELYLACTLGHSSFFMSSYYIHISDAKAAEIEKRMAEVNDEIMPDFDDDDGGDIYG